MPDRNKSTSPLINKLLEKMRHEPVRELELEDLAYDFIEFEVGRHDWRRNWRRLRSTRNMVEYARRWLNATGSKADPVELVKWIDRFAEKTCKPWTG